MVRNVLALYRSDKVPVPAAQTITARLWELGTVVVKGYIDSIEKLRKDLVDEIQKDAELDLKGQEIAERKRTNNLKEQELKLLGSKTKDAE